MLNLGLALFGLNYLRFLFKLQKRLYLILQMLQCMDKCECTQQNRHSHTADSQISLGYRDVVKIPVNMWDGEQCNNIWRLKAVSLSQSSPFKMFTRRGFVSGLNHLSPGSHSTNQYYHRGTISFAKSEFLNKPWVWLRQKIIQIYLIEQWDLMLNSPYFNKSVNR